MSASTVFDSAIGPLTIRVNDEGAVEEIWFGRKDPGANDRGACMPVIVQLREYLDGQRTTFDLELAPRGTGFQLAVWNELLNIRYGTTISYGELARRIGKPEAVRAVGAANGANPIPIVIPCHRVIGSDGSLTGYGGGLDIKRALLALEKPQRTLL